jgi:hypothetical protein
MGTSAMFHGRKPDVSDPDVVVRPRASAEILRFFSVEEGVATVDWVVIAAGLTALGLMILTFGQEGLGTFTADVRDEVQSPYFETSWTDSLPINQ